LRPWHRLAGCIPDAPIRQDALSAITSKRSHIDGAALFSALPHERDHHLMRVLVAYQIMWDFLDSVNERGACAGMTNGLQLHLALTDALDPYQPPSNYYLHNFWRDDSNYLRMLVTTCREGCAQLPAYAGARPGVIHEAQRSQVCAINHHHDPLARDLALKAWVTSELPEAHEALWFELTAAASTDLTIFALLASTSEIRCPEDKRSRIVGAYFPWASSLAALLDSYVDQLEDALTGNHSYISHYATTEMATHHMSQLMDRCLREMASLQQGDKHILISACMFAMYLSKRSALSTARRETTMRLVIAGGTLTRLLHPILQLWRAVYGLSAA
jgi:tetraprenyl-beta-curcumene synthase